MRIERAKDAGRALSSVPALDLLNGDHVNNRSIAEFALGRFTKK